MRFLGIILFSNLKFLYGFLKNRERGMVFYQVFLLSPLQCTVTNVRGCVSLKKYSKPIEVTVNSKEENS
jgi:hypothetical protein